MGWLGCGGAQRARQPSPTVPSRTQARVSAAWSAAEEKRVRKKDVVRLTSGAQTSAKEKERSVKLGCWAASAELMGCAGG
jgi:hypothetical protein